MGRTVSDEDTGQQDVKDDTGQQDDLERYKSGQIAEKPEPSDEQKKHAEEMAKSYVEERPTTVLPGSDSTVTGTAVNDWIDDDGNPIHGEIDENRKEAAERDRERNQRAQGSDSEDSDSEDSDSDDSDSPD